jgi:hypothetical protein
MLTSATYTDAEIADLRAVAVDGVLTHCEVLTEVADFDELLEAMRELKHRRNLLVEMGRLVSPGARRSR